MKKGVTAVITACLLIASTTAWAQGEPDLTAHPPIHIRQGGTKATCAGGYAPAQIKDAYGFNKLPYSGAGQKIAIIDAFGSPSIKNDVEVFDKQFHLPPADLCICYPEGTKFQNDPYWAGETSLDVEWAHALAQGRRSCSW
jgi:subtilase family serine protease